MNTATRHNARCQNCKMKMSFLGWNTHERINRDFEPVGPTERAGHLWIDADGRKMIGRINTGTVVFFCSCETWTQGRRVHGKVKASKACDARCMGATGASCECSCGGLNHGANNG